MIIEIPIPPPEPNIFANTAPAYPSIAEIFNCSNTKILDKPTGFSPVNVAIIPSMG